MAKLLIDESELKLLLEEHREEIGVKASFTDIFAGFVFTAQSIFASYYDLFRLPPAVWQGLFISIGGLFAIRSIFLFIKSKRNTFSQLSLYEDIIKMNQTEHPFSIIAIKDDYRPFPNKYLLYYDTRWSCWFFPNFRTIPDESENRRIICDKLSGQLKITPDSIELQRKADVIHRKYSVPNHTGKTYNHTLYDAKIDSFPDIMQHDHFNIDGLDYAWMSIPEMEKDPAIQEHNMDVVSFVKNYS